MAILFSSDHSLCGSFNERIVQAAEAVRQSYPTGQQWKWLAVGARAALALEAADQTPADRIFLPGTAQGLVETSHRILLSIDDWYASKDVTTVLVFHDRRRADVASPHHLQLLPLDPHWLQKLATRPWQSRARPMFTMEVPALMSALTREHIFASMFRSGAESLLSEHAARYAAMQAALRNIEDHLQERTVKYRRKRHEAITSELLDVVSVYETLRKERRA
ncbi:MAG: F0F1 ATP synthase subunit gamma [Hyphomicrobiales bacterium]|nr:F0F1 ATP synthase subunit gamma [Hyphomicrobiales bacterium]